MVVKVFLTAYSGDLLGHGYVLNTKHSRVESRLTTMAGRAGADDL